MTRQTVAGIVRGVRQPLPQRMPSVEVVLMKLVGRLRHSFSSSLIVKHRLSSALSPGNVGLISASALSATMSSQTRLRRRQTYLTESGARLAKPGRRLTAPRNHLAMLGMRPAVSEWHLAKSGSRPAVSELRPTKSGSRPAVSEWYLARSRSRPTERRKHPAPAANSSGRITNSSGGTVTAGGYAA